MRALVYEGPWQMPLRDIDTPAPAPNDVIVAVQAAGICGSDVHGFTGSTGRRTPGIVMGHEFTGRITDTGPLVEGYAVGDRVIVQPLATCGTCEMCMEGKPNVCFNRTLIGMHTHGAYADSVRVPTEQLYRLPDSLTWEQGAMVEPLSVALHAVNLTPMSLMDTVVIVGAGTIGLLALLAARLKGAGHVIVTDLSDHRLALAKQLGADIAINIGQEDPIAAVKDATDGAGARAVIEAVGISATVQQALAVARIGGNITWIGNSAPEVTLNMQQVVTREITIRGTYGFNQEFGMAIEALRQGRIDVRPLIERVAPLEEGPELIHDLAKGTLDVAKVVLTP